MGIWWLGSRNWCKVWDLLRVMRGEKRISERWPKEEKDEEEEVVREKESKKKIVKDDIRKT